MLEKQYLNFDHKFRSKLLLENGKFIQNPKFWFKDGHSVNNLKKTRTNL